MTDRPTFCSPCEYWYRYALIALCGTSSFHVANRSTQYTARCPTFSGVVLNTRRQWNINWVLCPHCVSLHPYVNQSYPSGNHPTTTDFLSADLTIPGLQTGCTVRYAPRIFHLIVIPLIMAIQVLAYVERLRSTCSTIPSDHLCVTAQAPLDRFSDVCTPPCTCFSTATCSLEGSWSSG